MRVSCGLGFLSWAMETNEQDDDDDELKTSHCVPLTLSDSRSSLAVAKQDVMDAKKTKHFCIR